MAAGKIDAIDRKILAELQADGRMTNVELRQAIDSPDTQQRQADLLRALGFEPRTAVKLSDTLADSFVLEPSILKTTN